MLVTWTSLIIALLVGGGFGAYLLVRDVQTAWRVRLAESGRGVARVIQDLLSHTREDLSALDSLGVPELQANPQLASAAGRPTSAKCRSPIPVSPTLCWPNRR
jgi:hypothetical protein